MWVDDEEDLAKKYTKNLSRSMKVLRDGAIKRAFDRLMGQEDELYETVEIHEEEPKNETL